MRTTMSKRIFIVVLIQIFLSFFGVWSWGSSGSASAIGGCSGSNLTSKDLSGDSAGSSESGDGDSSSLVDGPIDIPITVAKTIDSIDATLTEGINDNGALKI